MSHFTVGVIIPKDVMEKGHEVANRYVENQLEPFSEDLQVEEYESTVSQETITAMLEHYKKASSDENIKECAEKWIGKEVFKKDDGTWYYLTDINPKGQWDWYKVGGRWDAHMYEGDQLIENPYIYTSNYATIAHVASKTYTFFALITPEGEWLEKAFGTADKEMSEKAWREIIQGTYDKHKNDYLCLVDCHV